jgi:UDP-N-acetylglucosamine 2-epimerase (non-hydrolysing)
VVDALLGAVHKINTNPSIKTQMTERFNFIDPSKKIIIFTGHRRENLGYRFDQICQALKVLANRSDVQIIYPVHLNPSVQEPVKRILGQISNIRLIDPLDYLPFVYLMTRSYLIISDSGGVQEEAPTLGKPVLVTRDTTERPEAVKAGLVKLVGTNQKKIIDEASILLDKGDIYSSMTRAINPYGDGMAASRIQKIIQDFLC